MYRIQKLFMAGASALALSASSLNVSAQGISFEIVPRIKDDAPAALNLQRWMDFEASVSLLVKTDPALVPSARVLEMVRAIRMVDDAGISITRGYAVDAQHNLVIGWSEGSAEIIKVQDTDQGLTVMALFKDNQGRIAVPPAGSLAAYTVNGERLCFAEEIVSVKDGGNMLLGDIGTEASGQSSHVPMAFALLLDRSGSMSHLREDVDHAALSFIDALPDGATCIVGGFASSFSLDNRDGYGTNACRKDAFTLAGGRDLGGGTDLFAALNIIYESFGSGTWDNEQKAVIIITDGGLNESLELKEELLAKRGDVLTFVYFLGGNTDEHLKELAHHYLEHEGALEPALQRYFDVVSTAYRKQTIIKVRPCESR